MPEEPVNPLQFARDVARLRERLEPWTCEYLPIEEQSASKTGFLVLLNELTNGTEPVTAVVKAMRAHDRVYENKHDHFEAVGKQRMSEAAELAAEEEITRKVECPYCGVSAGMKCRGTGASGGLKNKSHRDRYRLARSLNDGQHEQAAEV